MEHNTLILALVALLGFVAVMLAQILQTRELFKPITTLLEKITTEKNVTSTLDSAFNRLDPDTQSKLRRFVDVLDPMTDAVPGDLDDKVVDWLYSITDGLPNQPVVITPPDNG